MDEKYDYIVLGTGLKECILSGLLSVQGKKVLHMDRNNYYGGESTSFNPLKELYKYFGREDAYSDTKLGNPRDWNVDLIPKFLMGDGKLVRLLVKTGVTRYLNFKVIEGSYVYIEGVCEKVPCNETEALKSTMMGLFEKRRFRNFLAWTVGYEEGKTKSKYNMKGPINDILNDYSLSKTTKDFIGHAICLYRDESYLHQVPACEVVERIKLYSNSLARFAKSPYLYPLYGLGELPQSFARLSAVYGGTYMLDMPDAEIVYENGKAIGVKSKDEVAKCDKIICDPSYAKEKCKVVGQVVRCICICNAPITNSKTAQIIIPQNQVNRKNDIYMTMCSADNNVAAAGYYLFLVATTVEKPGGNPDDEIAAGLALLNGKIVEKFTKVYDMYAPNHDPKESNVFISESYDATTHFETTCDDVIKIYEQVTGEKFDFDQMKSLNIDEDPQ